MIRIGARATFCAAHRLPQHADVHGHSYVVWAYAVEGMDAEQLQRDLAQACLAFDHRLLNEVMDTEPTMENIARVLVARLPREVIEIEIDRPVEGLRAKFKRDL